MGSIRFSLSRDNSVEDVDQVIEALPSIIDKLRALSPFGAGADKERAEFKPLYA